MLKKTKKFVGLFNPLFSNGFFLLLNIYSTGNNQREENSEVNLCINNNYKTAPGIRNVFKNISNEKLLVNIYKNSSQYGSNLYFNLFFSIICSFFLLDKDSNQYEKNKEKINILMNRVWNFFNFDSEYDYLVKKTIEGLIVFFYKDLGELKLKNSFKFKNYKEEEKNCIKLLQDLFDKRDFSYLISYFIGTKELFDPKDQKEIQNIINRFSNIEYYKKKKSITEKDINKILMKEKNDNIIMFFLVLLGIVYVTNILFNFQNLTLFKTIFQIINLETIILFLMFGFFSQETEYTGLLFDFCCYILTIVLTIKMFRNQYNFYYFLGVSLMISVLLYTYINNGFYKKYENKNVSVVFLGLVFFILLSYIYYIIYINRVNILPKTEQYLVKLMFVFICVLLLTFFIYRAEKYDSYSIENGEQYIKKFVLELELEIFLEKVITSIKKKLEVFYLNNTTTLIETQTQIQIQRENVYIALIFFCFSMILL